MLRSLGCFSGLDSRRELATLLALERMSVK